MSPKGTIYLVPAFDVEGPEDFKGKNKTWKELKATISRICSQEFRAKCKDGIGNRAIYSWFVVDHVGYISNPRNVAIGFHTVYDQYRTSLLSDENLARSGDGVYWHYHHPPADGHWSSPEVYPWNTDWLDGRVYEDVLCHKIVEMDWFPPIFRAGGTIENNDTSAWLEKWIPFDWSNRAPESTKTMKKSYSRADELYDWSRAPMDWRMYHPSMDDYQAEGKMRRRIIRCLDISSESHELSEDDIDSAFLRAEEELDTIISYQTHDWSVSIEEELSHAYSLVKKVSMKHPDVTWRYANAVGAVRAGLGYNDRTPLSFDLKIEDAKLIIHSSKELFGTMPFLALRFRDGSYIHDEGLISCGAKKWEYHVGEPAKVEVLGVGASDPFGNTGTAKIRI